MHFVPTEGSGAIRGASQACLRAEIFPPPVRAATARSCFLFQSPSSAMTRLPNHTARLICVNDWEPDAEPTASMGRRDRLFIALIVLADLACVSEGRLFR